MKAITHIGNRRHSLLRMTPIIMYLTGMTEQEYCNFKYKCGLEFLSIYTNGDVLAFKELEASKIFWNWWKNLWLIRDEEFDYPDLYQISKEQRLMIYKQLHNPRMLATQNAPAGQGIRISFQLMLEQAINQIDSKIHQPQTI